MLEARRAALAISARPVTSLARPLACPDRDRRRAERAGGRYRLLFSPLRLGPVVSGTASCSRPTSPTTPRTACRPSSTPPTTRPEPPAGPGSSSPRSTRPIRPTGRTRSSSTASTPRSSRATAGSPTAVHRHGTPIFAQINHNGGQGPGCTAACRSGPRRRWPTRCSGRCRKAVDEPEIDEIVAGYAQVAGALRRRRLRRGRAAVLALLDRARASCRRPPTFGPTATAAPWRAGPGPARDPDAVRDAIGPELAIGVRLCGDELIEGGTTIDEAVAVARMVEATGPGRLRQHLDRRGDGDALHDRGVDARPTGLRRFIPSRIRKAVALPVVGAGRYKDPLQAERALRDGPLRPHRRGAGPDRRPRLRGQGAGGAGRRDPALPVLQPGVRRPHGPQPLARLHREPPHRPGVGRARAAEPPGHAGGRGRRRARRAAGGRRRGPRGQR